MTIGMRVRAIRSPYFGKLGLISGLPKRLQVLDTEAEARVLKVKFDDGTEAMLPRANVELIVER